MKAGIMHSNEGIWSQCRAQSLESFQAVPVKRAYRVGNLVTGSECCRKRNLPFATLAGKLLYEVAGIEKCYVYGPASLIA